MTDSSRSPTPHDALFKWTFSQAEHFAGELRHVLPSALGGKLDFGSLVVCDGSFVDERLIGRHSDLLYSVKLAARDALVYVLFEHQSSVDRHMPLRLLAYMVRVWDWYLTEKPTAAHLPPILPVVLHHSATGWRASRSFHALLDVDMHDHPELAPLVPSFEFLLDDVSHESDQHLRSRAMTALARLVLWCLRDARHPDDLIDRIPLWAALFVQVWTEPGGLEALKRVFTYTMEVAGRHSYRKLEAAIMQNVEKDTAGDEPFVSIADWLREQGRDQARRALVSKLLALRFGELSEEVRARIDAADSDALETWAERLITASTLEEVVGE